MDRERVVAIAGNPNVGKSTVFNNLTNLHQHTGNWPGKTVVNATGYCSTEKFSYKMVDIPGTYSLMAHSAEEEVARDFICFGDADAVVVVCDATCLERNLNLVLQTMEITGSVIVCVNLLDEAAKKGIHIDLDALSKELGVPVIGMVARDGKGIDELLDTLDDMMDSERITVKAVAVCCADDGRRMYDSDGRYRICYPDAVEQAIAILEPAAEAVLEETALQYEKCRIGQRKLKGPGPRWLALKLLDYDSALDEGVRTYLQKDICQELPVREALPRAEKLLAQAGLDQKRLEEEIVSSVMATAEEISRAAVANEKERSDLKDRKIDHILTGKWLGYPIMAVLLMVILWLTITGANYPSQMLSKALFWVQDRLTEFFRYMGAPAWLHGMLVLGVYRVLAWVVSVMLPPMAIFFPLFTLLEDVGYLPRIAYNLDKPFKKCCACGKQALTLCMGFGCNAAGVTGCRIIDSPRERLIAILTNSLVPCNGRFPTLIAIITMFFIGTSKGAGTSLLSAILLTLFIMLGVGMTFLVSWLLSRTILKGVPSSFTLELPPYRRPQFGKVIVRSIFDRTLFVLGRAVMVAAPAGLFIWAAANIFVGDQSLLNYCAAMLDPFARLFGLDGVILIAFILGLPANEIVVPIIIMAYMAQGSILEMDSLTEMRNLFVSHGWTWVTAVCTTLFSLMHWPCSTTLLTIKKETGSWKWTFTALVIPTLAGMVLCFIVAQTAYLFI
ncbi:ferrous iron transport protein B [Faecalicatena orotica]|uniref:Ferrous iron transport protein B n=1 Tax=Faecalicatena orotica TaxID=1544 RepID=A0A2Y9BHZ1_9FIRM|nr:ferrous iron transport protein B [Faecalicatena orotica]PWJ23705.1 ferrous iron transport protein B [Faecalicatena orotica]SSA57617.1 ferrous iron transport protein B [Faecalicatena orotica]